MDFSETIAACDLKVGRCRQPIQLMKVCEYLRSMSFLYHIFSRFCMFCALLGQDIRQIIWKYEHGRHGKIIF